MWLKTGRFCESLRRTVDIATLSFPQVEDSEVMHLLLGKTNKPLNALASQSKTSIFWYLGVH